MPKSQLPNGVPSAANFGQLRAYLARAGVKQADITAVIGNGAAGRTRQQIAEQLKTWLNTLPKLAA